MRLRCGGPKTDWNRLVPLKVRICNWRAHIDKLPTKENLAKRNVQLYNGTCVLCNETNETKDHIFVSCSQATKVRDTINTWRELFPRNWRTSGRIWRRNVLLEKSQDRRISGSCGAVEMKRFLTTKISIPLERLIRSTLWLAFGARREVLLIGI